MPPMAESNIQETTKSVCKGRIALNGKISLIKLGTTY
jgi:hypothetical protein